MQHFIHVSVKIPEGLGIPAPGFVHDERVYIATEPWGTMEREFLQLRGMSAPAFGIRERVLSPTGNSIRERRGTL